LVRDSKSQCTSDSTLTVTCYMFPGHNSGAAYEGQQAQTRWIRGVEHDFTRLSQTEASMGVIHEVPAKFWHRLTLRDAEFVVEHAVCADRAAGRPHVRLVTYESPTKTHHLRRWIFFKLPALGAQLHLG